MANRVKREPRPINTTVADAISTAFGVITELAEEMREAFDNTPESLQSSGAGEARGEAADALEQISEPDVPEGLGDLPVTFSLLPLPRKASRADRLSDGLEYAKQAISVLEDHKQKLEDGNADEDEGWEDYEGEDAKVVLLDEHDPEAFTKAIVDAFEEKMATKVILMDDRGGTGAIKALLMGLEREEVASADDVDTFIDEVQAMVDEAEEVSFPGMFG